MDNGTGGSFVPVVVMVVCRPLVDIDQREGSVAKVDGLGGSIIAVFGFIGGQFIVNVNGRGGFVVECGG